MEALEGSEVLEKLVEAGLIDEFMAAVDSDNIGKAKALLNSAGIDQLTIASVLEQMAEADHSQRISAAVFSLHDTED